jgi:guanylate kinase
LPTRLADNLASVLTPPRGRLIVLSGPSGAGKDSVLHALLCGPNSPCLLVKCITATTRDPRDGEQDGVDYFFITESSFKNRIRSGFFLEHADYNDRLYGTPVDFVQKERDKGNDVILKIEVQGALQVKEKAPDAILIFLTPPSWGALEQRLTERATEKHEDVASRLEIARREMDTAPKYDYLVVNDKVEDAVEALKAIILAERHRIISPK